MKLAAGQPVPSLEIAALDGGKITLGVPENGHDWQMVVVYRGKHCPLCTRQLTELNTLLDDYNANGIDVVAISADPEEKARAHMADIQPKFRVGYGLSTDQMHALGLYVSAPRSAQETDRPFSEPGLFVINDLGTLQVTDIGNAPFVRPSLPSLAMGLKFIRNPQNDYPIRGTHA